MNHFRIFPTSVKRIKNYGKEWSGGRNLERPNVVTNISKFKNWQCQKLQQF